MVFCPINSKISKFNLVGHSTVSQTYGTKTKTQIRNDSSSMNTIYQIKNEKLGMNGTLKVISLACLNSSRAKTLLLNDPLSMYITRTYHPSSQASLASRNNGRRSHTRTHKDWLNWFNVLSNSVCAAHFLKFLILFSAVDAVFIENSSINWGRARVFD